MAQPVEPFGFAHVQGGLPPPLPEDDRDSMGQQPGLFEKADCRLINELQYLHTGDGRS